MRSTERHPWARQRGIGADRINFSRPAQKDPLLVATGGCGSGRQILTTGT